MNLDALFNPKKIAVIGVSLSNDNHPANIIFSKNHHRYPVDIYGVNPRGGVLQDQHIYKSILEIEGPVDLAVISVRADMVRDSLRQCIESGVRSTVVISGGFSETGRQDLQDELVAMARDADMPLIGPNCLGVFVPNKFDTLFLPMERMILPHAGSIAFISQSGGVLVDQMIRFSGEGIGISRSISIGNKALIGEVDLLEYLADDPMTGVIALYVEGFGKNEGRHFVEAARACSKPVVVLKSGKTAAGSQAVSSHTAALAGDYENFKAALSQHGVVEAETEEDLASLCDVLSAYPAGIKGHVAVITGSGGHGALATDACSTNGLQLPALSEREKKELASLLTPSVQVIGSYHNPIDLTGSARDQDFVEAVQYCARTGRYDCILMLLLPYIPGITSDLSARLSAVAQREKIPLLAYVPHEEKYAMFVEGFQLNGIPVAPTIEGAVLMTAALMRRQSR